MIDLKEKIYTIPVSDAFDAEGECPLCALHKKLDNEILDYILGPSYMEEDIRYETNKHGFCKYHYDKMYSAQNRLGVALMVSTHLKKINEDLDNVLKEETSTDKRKGFLKKQTEAFPLEEYTEKLSSSCYACKRMESRMNSYIETIFYLWKKEPEFRQKIVRGKGFCIEHFSLLVSEARKRMNNRELSEFLETVIPIEKENLARIEKELDWFIRKFDYRFQDEPWKNSKDSLERAILKISSLMVNDEVK